MYVVSVEIISKQYNFKVHHQKLIDMHKRTYTCELYAIIQFEFTTVSTSKLLTQNVQTC